MWKGVSEKQAVEGRWNRQALGSGDHIEVCWSLKGKPIFYLASHSLVEAHNDPCVIYQTPAQMRCKFGRIVHRLVRMSEEPCSTTTTPASELNDRLPSSCILAASSQTQRARCYPASRTLHETSDTCFLFSNPLFQLLLSMRWKMTTLTLHTSSISVSPDF